MPERTLARDESNENFLRERYSLLVSCWNHQNSVRMQWPSIVLAASLLVVSDVDAEVVADPARWGNSVTTFLSTGAPLLIAGLAALVMIYIMIRATVNMRDLLAEILAIESRFEVGTAFDDLNHQPGISGPTLLAALLALTVGIPLVTAGCLVSLGALEGALASAVTLLVAFGCTAFVYFRSRSSTTR